jgi:hypothetical protein
MHFKYYVHLVLSLEFVFTVAVQLNSEGSNTSFKTGRRKQFFAAAFLRNNLKFLYIRSKLLKMQENFACKLADPCVLIHINVDKKNFQVMELTTCLIISFVFGVTAHVYVYRASALKFIERSNLFIKLFLYKSYDLS